MDAPSFDPAAPLRQREEQRRQTRQRDATPVLAAFKVWLDQT